MKVEALFFCALRGVALLYNPKNKIVEEESIFRVNKRIISYIGVWDGGL
jgi:hypothetical protein